MNLEKLFQVLSAMYPLSEEFKDALHHSLTLLSLPKHHLLLEAPKISDHAFFLQKGFMISYRFTEGRKQIENFWKEGDIIISPTSFFDRIPSKEFIHLMQASEVLCISHEGVMKLFAHHVEANFIYRKVMNQYYELARERLYDLQHLTAGERYKKMLTSFPQIETLVPSEYVASYLGMERQSLSRVKREIGRG